MNPVLHSAYNKLFESRCQKPKLGVAETNGHYRVDDERLARKIVHPVYVARPMWVEVCPKPVADVAQGSFSDVGTQSAWVRLVVSTKNVNSWEVLVWPHLVIPANVGNDGAGFGVVAFKGAILNSSARRALNFSMSRLISRKMFSYFCRIMSGGGSARRNPFVIAAQFMGESADKWMSSSGLTLVVRQGIYAGKGKGFPRRPGAASFSRLLVIFAGYLIRRKNITPAEVVFVTT